LAIRAQTAHGLQSPFAAAPLDALLIASMRPFYAPRVAAVMNVAWSVFYWAMGPPRPRPG